jgi:hypothetical protein
MIKKTFAILSVIIFSCASPKEERLKINQVQVIGSHNSYKKKIEEPIMKMMLEKDSGAVGLDYYHLPIKDQLDLGLRGLEIDVLHDPLGGRYEAPVAIVLLQRKKVSTLPYDSLHELSKPGLKVLHIPDMDFRTHCYTFVSCLSEVKSWSEAHPDHLPIIITINPKTSGIDEPGFTTVLPFSANVLDSLDQEILSVFPDSKLITPTAVKGKHASLREAVIETGWPAIDESKGKVMFVLDAGKDVTTDYISLKSNRKVMFVNVDEKHPEAAFFIMNNPKEQKEEIARLVKQGFMVRTRADADTREARTEDYTRFKSAAESGAQLISTDYYVSKLSPTGKFEITLDGKYQRCNPVNGVTNCNLK